MVTTPNLAITHVEQSQSNKEASINTALDRLDNSNNDPINISVAAGGTIVVTAAQKLDNVLIRCTGAPGSAVTLELPDGDRALHVESAISTSQVITVETATGAAAPVDLDQNETVAIDVRGTDITVVGVIGDGSGGGGGGASFGRKSEYLPSKALEPSVSDGCSALATVEGTAAQPNVKVRDFDSGATIEEAQFDFQFPNRWDKGTITFEVEYTHVGGQTGGLDGVAWGLAGVHVPDDTAWDVATGTEIIVTLDRADAGDVHRTAESAALTIAGSIGDGGHNFFILRRVTSDGADDLDIDARLIGVRLFWTEDAAVDD